MYLFGGGDLEVLIGYRRAALQARPAVVAIGNFDGVHRGHQAILSRMVAKAQAEALCPLVYTFRPHPLKVLVPHRAPALLSSYAQKNALLGRYGAEVVVEEPFDMAYAALSPEDFVREILVGALQTKRILVGPDFTFGKGGKATPADLATLGEGWGIQVEIVEAQHVGEIRVSSSRVRQACLAGEVELAATLLGRPFLLSGLVTHGDARGRHIGFPTANLEPWQEIRPAKGVYACWASWGEAWHPAVVNLGTRPTFQGETLRVEAHLLDLQRDLYEKPLCLAFVKPLRPEAPFHDIHALREQIERDCRQARAFFADLAPPQEPPWLLG